MKIVLFPVAKTWPSGQENSTVEPNTVSKLVPTAPTNKSYHLLFQNKLKTIFKISSCLDRPKKFQYYLPSPATKGGQSAENTAENPLAFLLASVLNRICISPLSADKMKLVGFASVKSGPWYNLIPVLSPSKT